MSELPTFHGHIVELRRHVNVHCCHLHPIAPTDRWELWLCAPDGTERKFTVHTRDMPARRGHEVSLITTTHICPRVLALANWTTIDASTTPAASRRVWCGWVTCRGWPRVSSA
jgi:hypothetical protein